MAEKKRSTKNKGSLGVAFWLLFFIVMAALFIINYPKIQRTWENVFGKGAQTDQGGGSPEPEVRPPLEPLLPPSVGTENPDTNNGDSENNIVENTEQTQNKTSVEQIPENNGNPVDSRKAVDSGNPANPESTAVAGDSMPAVVRPPPPEVQQNQRERTLYFVRVDSNGMVFIAAAKRMVMSKGAPLGEALSALLLGPNKQEKKDGLVSLIPEGSRVLGARIDSNTAFINFNENFMFNGFGAEGYIAQLRQIVWTATEFSSVHDVQILIEGRKIDFLGEAIRIDRPLNRNSL